MMSHSEAEGLLGAYALDAVERDEAQAIDMHLETCPRCRAELRNHHEVVGLLAYAGQEAPEGLWDRIQAHLTYESGPGEPTPITLPWLRLVEPEGATGEGALVASVPTGRSSSRPLAAEQRGSASRPEPRRFRSRRMYQFTAMVAAAAVAVVALLGVEVAHLQNRTNDLSHQVSAMGPTMNNVRQALSVPGAKTVVLKAPSSGSDTLDAVILPSGDGYLYSPKLNPLSPAQTYQLWGVVGGQSISYGVLGSAVAQVVQFRASNGVQALAVTSEVAGGVVTTTHKPVVLGVLA